LTTTYSPISTVYRDFARIKLIGDSPQFLKILDIINQVSDTEAPVLICGETGTGKELAARAIHYLSRRRERPFIPVNCGAIPDNLLESELFGHVEGAFTDAKQKRTGLVTEADGGTLFLDELEALTPKGQVVLLRFLEDRAFRPVGQSRLKETDTRIVSAVNSDLKSAAEEGRFRFDLLYRLAVISFTLPPLRDRGDDKHLLSDHFLKECAGEYGRPPRPLHEDVVDTIDTYDWPGNVRELKNFIHSAFITSSGPTIALPVAGILGPTRTDIGRQRPLLDTPLAEAKASVVNDFERAYILRMLRKTEGNISQAAKLAGKDRRSFGRLIRKHNIEVASSQKMVKP
jgi:two-component system response regulator GlrR